MTAVAFPQKPRVESNLMLHRLTINMMFLVDAAGAIVTASMLGIVLPLLEEYIGMPRAVLVPLAIAASCFAVYSLSCYRLIRSNGRSFLRAIAIANGLYCVVTFSLIVHFWDVLTTLGIVYFLGEIMIIVALVGLEWRVAATGRVSSLEEG